MKVDKCQICGEPVYFLEDVCEECGEELQKAYEQEQREMERQYRKDVL